MATNLIKIATQETAPALFEKGGTGDIVSRIEEEARALVADTSTSKGRKAIASNAAKVARSKTYLDEIGKNLVAGLKKQTTAVDSERREMRNRLDALKVEVRQPLTDFEEAEEARKDAIRIRIESIQQDIPIGSDAIMSRRAIVEKIAIDDSWSEFAPQAAMAKDAELSRLRCAYDIALESERAEAERKEAAARAQKEREAQIAAEAAEKARVEAERKAAAAAEDERRKQEAKARESEFKRLEAERNAAAKERELIDAELAAIDAQRLQKQAEENATRQAKQAAEAARQEAELAAMQRRESEEREAAAAAAEARRKAEDKAHRAKVNRAALSALQEECGLSHRDAKAVIIAIASGKIPNVSINY